MNLTYGHLETEGQNVYAVLPNARILVGGSVLAKHPGLEHYTDKELVVGLRPSDLEAAPVHGGDRERSMVVNVEVTEMLGADTFIHFTVDRQPVVTPDIEELLADSGQTADSLGDKTNFVARLNPDIQVKHGDQVELNVDNQKLLFFDADTGNRIGVKKAVPAAS
jgi:ABC-type sugar transport system ATPase subunit